MLKEGYTIVEIANDLKRTPDAVSLKRKRLSLPSASASSMAVSGRKVARMFGAGCEKTVTWWIEQGHLNAARIPGGPTGKWRISLEAIYDFVGNSDTWSLWEVERVTDRDLRTYAEELRGHDWLLLQSEVAERYHVQTQTVRRWTECGYLPFVQRGRGNRMIPSSALVGFVVPSERDRRGRGRRYFTTSEDAQLVTLRTGGHSWPEIARVLGRHASVCSSRWRRIAGHEDVLVAVRVLDAEPSEVPA
jgi:hypothetical protein